MNAFRTLCALACATAATLTLAPLAQAELTREQKVDLGRGTQPLPSLALDGSNGYKIGGGGFASIVALSAYKGKLSGNYSTSGTASAKKLEADFGPYGSVNMSFKPEGSKQPVKLPKRCEGKPAKVQKGVWKGNLDFDAGYTEASARKAPGSVYYPGDYTCSGGGGGGKPVFLSGYKSGGGGFYSFSAVKPNKRAKPYFSAARSFLDSGVDVYLSGRTRGPIDSFTYNLNQQSASISPPSPFSGNGVLSGESWTGNLEAKIPGQTVDLISGFSVRLEQFG